jgi:hypothetical protein
MLKERDLMNDKMLDIGKYFCLTFISLEIMYYIARSRLNLGLVLMVSLIFTILYSLDKLKVSGMFFSGSRSTPTDKSNKNQSM